MFDRSAEVFGQETRKAKSVNETLGRFWSYFRKYRVTLIIVVILVIFNTAIQAAVPLLIGQTVDCTLAANLEQSASNCFLIQDIPETNGERLRVLGILVGIATLGFSFRPPSPRKCFTPSQSLATAC